MVSIILINGFISKTCETLDDVFKESSEKLDAVRPKSYLATVDCSAQKELKARF